MTDPVLGPADLLAFLDAHQIEAEILHLSTPTPTVETAALAVGCHPNQIVKSILFTIDSKPVLAITCGTDLIDRRFIASLYGVGRKRLKLAPPEVVQSLAGYEVGAMPPFGHRQPIDTLIDPGVLSYDFIFAGGGAENALLRVAPEEIVRVTAARLVSLKQAPAAEPEA